jgi:hypothetical protein
LRFGFLRFHPPTLIIIDIVPTSLTINTKTKHPHTPPIIQKAPN